MTVRAPRRIRLDGLAVVVTGSGRGIGAACASLAAELGARVVVNDIDAGTAHDVAGRIVDRGGRAFAHPADVSERSAAAGLVGHCLDAFGRIDGLVNNAALMSLGAVQDHDEHRLRRLLDVNVVGPFNCTAEAVPHLYAQGSGSVVNVTSGAHLGMWHAGDYAATKGAVASMTYSWAMEVEGTGVRVNGLSPLALGAMVTQTQGYLRATVEPDLVIDAPTPAENAPAVAYLLSDSSRHLNGQIVRTDGTRLSLLAHPSIVEPVLRRDRWTVDDVGAAFEAVLDARVSPTGIAWGTHPAVTADPGTVEFP